MAARAALKEGKASGPSQINAEIIKALPSSALRFLHERLQELFSDFEHTPKTWHDLVLVLLPKVTHPKEMSEYRGICL